MGRSAARAPLYAVSKGPAAGKWPCRRCSRHRDIPQCTTQRGTAWLSRRPCPRKQWTPVRPPKISRCHERVKKNRARVIAMLPCTICGDFAFATIHRGFRSPTPAATRGSFGRDSFCLTSIGVRTLMNPVRHMRWRTLLRGPQSSARCLPAIVVAEGRSGVQGGRFGELL